MIGSHRAGALQVGHQQFPNIDGQRDLLAPLAFAVHDDDTGSPVDVVQTQGRDLPGPQPHPPHQRQHRLIAASGHGIAWPMAR